MSGCARRLPRLAAQFPLRWIEGTPYRPASDSSYIATSPPSTSLASTDGLLRSSLLDVSLACDTVWSNQARHLEFLARHDSPLSTGGWLASAPAQTLTMKYLPIRELEHVASALNFNTSDSRVVGGCDLYTTKAAGSDKKLYKTIEQSLESQHESLLRLSESLSPPKADMFNMDLSRASPFGPLSQISSRRTFAYLIATLNASHPDYDFSQFLRPSDFKKERSLRRVVHTVDETLYSLRPRPLGALLASATGSSSYPTAPPTPGGSVVWSPRMWRYLDKEMTLKECEIYRYSPEEDPFTTDEGAIWSINYFFFNKIRRRVTYVHFRSLSASSHTAVKVPVQAKRARPIARSLSFEHVGASKRANFWLGQKADRYFVDGSWTENDEIIMEPGDDEVDADDAFDDGYSDDYSLADAVDDDDVARGNSIRAVSETMADAMDV